MLRFRSDALEAREEAEINFARLLTESGYDDTAYTSMDAARIFLKAVMDEHVCPYVAAKYLFGLDREQLDQLMESGDPVARKIRQVEGAQEFERLRSVGRVKRRAFDAAMGDSHPDRKLILQAYEPDTFVPTAKTALTGADQAIKVYVGIDPEEV